MSADNPRSPKPEQSKGTKPEKNTDPKNVGVSDDESSNVKGGLNPQPLPPRR